MDFLSIRWIDILDILLVAYLLYQLYRLVRETVAINILFGMLLLYVLWLIVRLFDMKLLSTILGQFIGLGAIALIIVFQQELRRFLIYLGSAGIFEKGGIWNKLNSILNPKNKRQITNLDVLVKACNDMASTQTGALIVISKKNDLKFYINTGDILEARLTKRLIESIFFKNSPLHDGAIIITGNKIRAARCILPVTENPDFPAHLGMRHRAAVGITEVSDAAAIVVSEQTGTISFVSKGIIHPNLSSNQLKDMLEKYLYE
ncbi:MAG: diadenylate cyclase CdaA [Bacteroidia bacterium]